MHELTPVSPSSQGSAEAKYKVGLVLEEEIQFTGVPRDVFFEKEKELTEAFATFRDSALYGSTSLRFDRWEDGGGGCSMGGL